MGLYLFVIGTVFILACSRNEGQEDGVSLSEATLLGTWSWQSGEARDITTGERGTLRVGEDNCYVFNVNDVLTCTDATAEVVNECQRLEAFEITFRNERDYDRIENYGNTNVEVDIVNDCAVILHENDKSETFTSGSWSLRGQNIELQELFSRRASTFYGTDRENEGPVNSQIFWQVLSFSKDEMVVRWLTPDQIEFEIRFLKQ